jgi:hypothetical protein
MIKHLIVVMMSACCLAVPVYGMMDRWTPKPNQNPLLQQRNIKYTILTEQYARTTMLKFSALTTLQQECVLQNQFDIATRLVRLCVNDGFDEPDFVTSQEFWNTERTKSLAKLLAIQRERELATMELGQTIIMPHPPETHVHSTSLHHKRRCIIL